MGSEGSDDLIVQEREGDGSGDEEDQTKFESPVLKGEDGTKCFTPGVLFHPDPL